MCWSSVLVSLQFLLASHLDELFILKIVFISRYYAVGWVPTSLLSTFHPERCLNSVHFRVQFPIECSLPWMLADHIIESQDGGLLESVLMPFDIYNDSAQQALNVLKQRFLYDEIEAEVLISFSCRNLINP